MQARGRDAVQDDFINFAQTTRRGLYCRRRSRVSRLKWIGSDDMGRGGSSFLPLVLVRSIKGAEENHMGKRNARATLVRASWAAVLAAGLGTAAGPRDAAATSFTWNIGNGAF